MSSHIPPQSNTTPLASHLHRKILQAGRLSFAEFMAEALYHPQYGYYMAPRDRIGKAGDFFTSSSVHTVFGRLVARQLTEMDGILSSGVFEIAGLPREEVENRFGALYKAFQYGAPPHGGMAAGILLGLFAGYHERKKENSYHRLAGMLLLLGLTSPGGLARSEGQREEKRRTPGSN